jgi:hypothetical protein
VSKKDYENPDVKLIDFEKSSSLLVGRLNVNQYKIKF